MAEETFKHPPLWLSANLLVIINNTVLALGNVSKVF